MRQVLGEIGAALRDVWRITFVTPVREGRPHPSAWPRGLREVGLATAIVFGLLAAAILLAGPLRQYGTLAMSTTTSDGVPELALPLLLTGALLSFALIVTAALHAVWWLRLILLVLGAAAVLFFSAQAWTNPVQLAVSVVAYLALVVFAFVRAFRDYAWWEFPVVSVLLMVATLFPWTSPLVGAGYGVDFRPGALHGALISLQFLVLPAVMVAGSAPAQIVVTGAQAAADRPVSTRLFWTAFAIAVGWLVVATVLESGGRELRWSSLAASALILIVVGAVIAVLLRRAGVRVPPAPGAYPEVWGGWLYPLATAVTVVVALTLPVIIVRGVLQLLEQQAAVDAINVALFAFTDSDPASVWRAGIGIVTLVLAWRLAGRNRLTEAVALGSFAVLVLVDAVGSRPGFTSLLDWTTTAIGVLAAGVALIGAAVLAITRRLDRPRAVGVMTIVLLAVLYPLRHVLENPLSVALALTPSVLLVFGLAWRVVTEAQVTYSSSRKYPQSTRVLLYLANTLLATTGVAFVALARATGTDVDPSRWGVLGDAVLGDPLYVTGLVTGLWLVLRPQAPPAVRPPDTVTTGDPSRFVR